MHSDVQSCKLFYPSDVKWVSLSLI